MFDLMAVRQLKCEGNVTQLVTFLCFSFVEMKCHEKPVKSPDFCCQEKKRDSSNCTCDMEWASRWLMKWKHLTYKFTTCHLMFHFKLRGIWSSRGDKFKSVPMYSQYFAKLNFPMQCFQKSLNLTCRVFCYQTYTFSALS